MTRGPKGGHASAWKRMGLGILQWGGSQRFTKSYTNENCKVRPRTLMRL